METTHQDLSDDTNQSLVALAVWKRELKEYQKSNKYNIILYKYFCTKSQIKSYMRYGNYTSRSFR